MSDLSLSPGGRILLGMALGDGLGLRFENLSRPSIPEKISYTGELRYTDDTQMALGVALAMLADEPFSPSVLAESLLAAYRQDPREGYSPLTRRMLEESESGADFLSFLSEEERMSRRSDGAAMRALPIGFFPDISVLIRHAAMSARITHGHPDSVYATTTIALLAHFRYYYNYSFPEIFREILRIIPDQDGISGYLQEIRSCPSFSASVILGAHVDYGVPYTESRIFLGAVLGVLQEYGEEPEKALLAAIHLGGDTDTTAAVVLGAAMIRDSHLPGYLLNAVDRGPFGYAYLEAVGERLSARYPREK